MRHSTHTREYELFLTLLKSFRKEAGVTQVDLALRLKITQSHLSKFERDELRIDLVQLRQLCMVLGNSLPALITRWAAELTKRTGGRKVK
jgi:transcriptional regulator with XRE-family HTH domain